MTTKLQVTLAVLCILIGGAVLLTPNGIVIIVANPVARIIIGAALVGVGAYAIAKMRQLATNV